MLYALELGYLVPVVEGLTRGAAPAASAAQIAEMEVAGAGFVSSNKKLG